MSIYRILFRFLRLGQAAFGGWSAGGGRGAVAVAVGALGLCLSGGVLGQTEQLPLDLEDEEQRLGYATGISVGENLKRVGTFEQIPIEAFLVGIRDAAEDSPQLPEEEIMAIIQVYQDRMQREAERRQREAEAALADSLAAGEAFLADNGSRAEVTVLASGLQYEVLESGPAGPSPGINDAVLAHYHGTLTDGSVFDSSIDRGQPAEFPVDGVIDGWTEALQIMKAGDKWRLYIPSGMAYGATPPTPAIPPNAVLIFDVELLEIR